MRATSCRKEETLPIAGTNREHPTGLDADTRSHAELEHVLAGTDTVAAATASWNAS